MPLNPPITDWRGRVAWLVGASTGIGRALAEALHAKGATVIVSARGAAGLNALNHHQRFCNFQLQLHYTIRSTIDLL